jgi:hypothetical protein
MSGSMRTACAVALGEMGFNPREGLRRALIASSYCRTALIDGKPAAMWGVIGGLMAHSANVWLVLSDEAVRIPRAVLREAKAELGHIMQDYVVVSATVLPDDAAAIRFALHLGFGGDDGEPWGEIMADPRYRMPVGDVSAIRLVYHPEAH